MTPLAPIVFLLDVDNTLLDNDQVIADLKQHLKRTLGPERQKRYWSIFEKLRATRGYADYLGALQRYRAENPRDAHFLQLSFYLLDYPFVSCLYPGALEVIKRFSTWGPTVILSDGDVTFQPWKVRQSGLYASVEGRALIYIHKEQQLVDIEKRYPAQHYVLVDDKLRILTAVKRVWGPRLTTVLPRQGHYAYDSKTLKSYPPADIMISRIGDLLQYDLPSLRAAARKGKTTTATRL